MGLIATALADGTDTERGAPTSTLDDSYFQSAIETQRALIAKPSGSGAIRGLHVYAGTLYCFRDNAGATAGQMFKATATGWELQSLGNRVSFTAGTAEFEEGETLTGGTSTANAVINRVVVQSGDWSSNDAAGYLIIGTVTNSPFQAETGTSASGSATLSGAETANTLAAGGKYEFRDHNFFGSTLTKRMYGVNGVSEAFEWDGTVFVPIITGNTVDTPTHLEINEAHLMLSFANGSLQNSATGTPYIWSGGGANETGVGHEIVGLQKEVGGAMVILCRERTYQLQGKNTVASPWDLGDISTETGGVEWTMQRLGRTRFLADIGFVSVDAVQEYGDFTSTAYSQVIEPLVTAKKTLALSSVIVKRKEQIRTFFSDGTGIVATFNNKRLVGFGPSLYRDNAGDPLVINCTANGEDSSGSEIFFYGGTDGFVYQGDSGTSFDGYAVEGWMVVAYNHCGSPAYDKSFKSVTMDVKGGLGNVVTYSPRFDYQSGREPAGGLLQQTLMNGSGAWGEALWNRFNWSAEDYSIVQGGIDGTGRNISLLISTQSTYAQPDEYYSINYNYILRKLVRA